MQSVYESLQLLGLQSLDVFWFPILVWTLVAFLVFMGLKIFRWLNPIYLYHLRVATLAAIPIGFITSFVIQKLGTDFQRSTFDPAVFILETPQTFYMQTDYSAVEFATNWFEPNFLIGLITSFIILGSIIMLIRLLISYFNLKTLHRSLSKTELTQHPEFNHSEYSGVKLAFHEHPMVPFTFGWKTPVIVLPEHIKQDHQKVRMAIQHELIHIQRGDYLIQLGLSVIESIFWFHPLIHFGSREIETYREISCDQQVLSTSSVSLKEYASMLYDLMPLNRELDSISVTMAVKQSTLKHRIETMKYHKLHNTSLKRSLLFLILMITAVTLPIACTDMRGPTVLSPEELESISINIQSPEIEVNGIEINDSDFSGGISTTGLGAILINAKEYGIFKVALSSFEGGKLSGELSDNKLTFSINELDVEVKSDSKILTVFNESPVWVEHLNIDTKQLSIGSLTNSDMQIPPPPPFLKENSGSLSDSKVLSLPTLKNDTFIVVEEMPQIIGGLASIQNRVEYPEMARRDGIEGRVTVQFVVNENGDVETPKIVRGIGGGADEAALAAISETKFIPGKQRGRNVRVQYTLPIIFRLNDTE